MTRSAPHEILSVEETRAADAAAIQAGTSGYVLMLRAGRAVADAVAERWSRRPVVILCGPGNNGGDGFVAAAALQEAGWPVRVALLGSREALSGDAALAAADWSGPVEPLDAESGSGAGVVIDALFGAGLRGALGPAARAPLAAAEAAGTPILAVDLPSGLGGDRAAPEGFAPRCAATVTFHRKKLAHVLEPGRSLCGDIEVADIGLAPPEGCRTFENLPSLWGALFPRPATDAHKHRRGRMAAVSGPVSGTGAARLAARAGLRVGAGLVTVWTPPDALLVNAAQLTAVMVRPFATPDALEVLAQSTDAVVIGPAAGVGERTRANLAALARTRARLVADADALTSFEGDPDALFALLDADDVLTPHVGEFARVFPGLLDAAPDRVAAAREAATRAGAILVLKGPDTVIAAPDGRAAINTNASPFLATAGSGDVLAGLAAGLAAQGMPGFEAACAAVWLHGAAGTALGPGLIAEDLPERMPAELAALFDAI